MYFFEPRLVVGVRPAVKIGPRVESTRGVENSLDPFFVELKQNKVMRWTKMGFSFINQWTQITLTVWYGYA